MQIRCIKCNFLKADNEFPRRYPQGIRTECNRCTSRYKREWSQENAKRHRDRAIQRRYGISGDEYRKMQAKQNNLCAVCNNPETTKKPSSDLVRDLAIDHCHKTGKVRELLCSGCNTILGRVKEDIHVLYAAIDYLKKHG